MSEPVIISAPSSPPEQSLSERWGLAAHYGLRFPITTSVSEGGLGHTLGLELTIAEAFEDRYTLAIEIPFGTTEQKILPSTDLEGNTAQHSHWAVMFGLGRFERSYPRFADDGDFVAALAVGTTPLMGVGGSTISRGDVTVDGETYKFDDASGRTFDIGTNYFFGGELRPFGGRGPVLTLGPALYYGLQYGGEGSEFNRVKLELMLMASVGYGDGTSISREESEGEIGAMGIVQGLYAMGHGFAQRMLYDKAINKPMEALDDYGLLGTGDDAQNRGSMWDVPLLSAGAAFLAGTSTPLTPALRAGEGWFWGFGALNTGSGIYFLAAGSDAAKGSGLADLMGSTRLISYALAGINTPSERLAMLPEDVEARQMYINLASYAANTAIMLIGAAANSDIAMSGGAGANMGVAMTPDPVEGTTVERTDIGYIPYTAYWGERAGNRAGIIVHKSWHDLPSENIQLFSSAALLSPMLILGNIGNMPAQDKQFSSEMLPSSVNASLGLEWKTTFTRLALGLDTCGVSGSEDSAAGVGGIAGFDITIPFNGEEDGSGIGLGVRASAHKLFPKGSDAEIAPWFGLTLHY